jgi:hypothetical protein
MRDLNPGEQADVSGGAMAAPYPLPGSTPPYVPPSPQSTAGDLLLRWPTREKVE